MQNLLRKQKCILYILLALVLVVGIQNVSLARGNEKLYWVEGTDIKRANLNGTNVEDVLTGLSSPKEITIDLRNRKLYWNEYGTEEFKGVTLGTNTLLRANPDGSDIEEVFKGYALPPKGGGVTVQCIRGVCDKVWIRPAGEARVEIDPKLLFRPRCFAINSLEEQIYWDEQLPTQLKRANFDGTDVEDIKVEKLASVWDIKLDIKRDQIYWVELTSRSIRRMNSDGTGLEDIITRWNVPILSFDLDVDAKQIYFTNTRTGTIQRTDFNGKRVEQIVSGLQGPREIVVNARSKRIYWSSWDRQTDLWKIQSANLNGSDVSDVATELNRIRGLAVDTEGVFDVSPADKLTTTWAHVKVRR